MFGAPLEYMKLNSLGCLVYKSIPCIYHTMPAQEDIYALFHSGAQLAKVEVSRAIQFGNVPAMRRGRRVQTNRAKGVEPSKNFEEFMEMETELLGEKYGVKPVHSAEEIELLFPQI
jgi:hypothetical protein